MMQRSCKCAGRSMFLPLCMSECRAMELKCAQSCLGALNGTEESHVPGGKHEAAFLEEEGEGTKPLDVL